MSNPGLNGGKGVNTLCQNMWGCTARIISSLLHQQEANLFVRFDGRAEFELGGFFFRELLALCFLVALRFEKRSL